MNPTDLAPDEYERDETGKILLNKNGTKKKKRGRKPGQSPKAKADAPKENASKKSSGKSSGGNDNARAVEMLAAQFQILNTGLAYLTRFPDWALDDSEAKQMADATANLMGEFDFTPDPKTTAVMGLVTTTSMIYGPRLYLYRNHLKEKQDEKREEKERAADERVVQAQSPDFGGFNYGGFSG